GQRGIEVFDLEKLRAGESAGAADSEPEVLALEGTATCERAYPPCRDYEAMPVDRGPGPADLQPLARRERPQRDKAVAVGIRPLDAAETGVPVVLEDQVIGSTLAEPRQIAGVPRVDEVPQQLHPGRRDRIDRRPARPRLALRRTLVVGAEEDDRDHQ